MFLVEFTLLSLYSSEKIPWYLLYRRMCGSQSPFGHGGEETNHCPPRKMRPGFSVVQFIAEMI
jgi:hypothetical protein